MKIKEISVTYGGKLNLGGFNSAHIEMTASALIEEGESPEAARTELLNFAQSAVQAKARELFAKRGARVEEMFAGNGAQSQA